MPKRSTSRKSSRRSSRKTSRSKTRTRKARSRRSSRKSSRSKARSRKSSKKSRGGKPQPQPPFQCVHRERHKDSVYCRPGISAVVEQGGVMFCKSGTQNTSDTCKVVDKYGEELPTCFDDKSNTPCKPKRN